MQCHLLNQVFTARYGELRPSMENLASLRSVNAKRSHLQCNCTGRTYFWARPTLQLRLNMPWQTWSPKLTKEDVVAHGIDILRINEKPIHVKQAGADFGEARRPISSKLTNTASLSSLRLGLYHDDSEIEAVRDRAGVQRLEKIRWQDGAQGKTTAVLSI